MAVTLSGRERFRRTLRGMRVDRVPYFEEGLRTEVLEAWRRQGLASPADLARRFPCDGRVEIEPDLAPRPPLRAWPQTEADLKAFARRFDANDPARLPEDWPDIVRTADSGQAVCMLRVHRGFFLSMGVDAWPRFHQLMVQLHRNPGLVASTLRIQGEFCAAMAARICARIRVDAALFSEPIGDRNGPLIPPQTYQTVVLASYAPLFEVLARCGVETIVFRTYANARALLPALLEQGFNCLWACEVDEAAMDYRDLRREFGPSLGLIGGIDLDALRCGPEAIYRELHAKVPPLLAQGRYIPMADGRVRPDVPFANYVYYRRLLQALTQST